MYRWYLNIWSDIDCYALLQKVDEEVLIENTDEKNGTVPFHNLPLSEETYCVFTACTRLKYKKCWLRSNLRTCSIGNEQSEWYVYALYIDNYCYQIILQMFSIYPSTCILKSTINDVKHVHAYFSVLYLLAAKKLFTAWQITKSHVEGIGLIM